MARRPRKNEARPATLGTELRSGGRLIVWCKRCEHQVTFGPAEIAAQVARYGEAVSLFAWRDRLVCSCCGGREVDFVAAGYRRPDQDWH